MKPDITQGCRSGICCGRSLYVQTNDIPTVLDPTNKLYNVSKLSIQMTKPRKPEVETCNNLRRLFQRWSCHKRQAMTFTVFVSICGPSTSRQAMSSSLPVNLPVPDRLRPSMSSFLPVDLAAGDRPWPSVPSSPFLPSDGYIVGTAGALFCFGFLRTMSLSDSLLMDAYRSGRLHNNGTYVISLHGCFNNQSETVVYLNGQYRPAWRFSFVYIA